MTGPRVCVVLKRSSWRKWVEEDRDARIAALLEAGDETVRRIQPGHRDHLETIEEVRSALAAFGADASWHDRANTFRVEGHCNLVVTIGGDGTLLAASHGIGPGVPLLGVNSSPNHSVGFFCAAKKGGVREVLGAALGGTLRGQELARMRVDLGERVLHERVLNEALFCHASPAATSRYIVRRTVDGDGVLEEEEQKSSGLWVGPAAGSTAAQRSAGGRILPLSSRQLQYVVREPYRRGSPDVGALQMTLGLVDEGQALVVRSKMRQARVFLDGDPVAHEMTIGESLTMRHSREPLVVLGLTRKREAKAKRSGA